MPAPIRQARASDLPTRPALDAQGEREKAESLDLIMATPVAYTTLVKGFERDGRQEEASAMRRQAGTLFESIFKLPHEIIAFKSNGDLDIDPEEAKRWQGANGISTGW